MLNNNNNQLISSREMLEYRKRILENQLEELKENHIPGETWDIWEDIINTRIFIEEIKREISDEAIKSLKTSLETYEKEIYA